MTVPCHVFNKKTSDLPKLSDGNALSFLYIVNMYFHGHVCTCNRLTAGDLQEGTGPAVSDTAGSCASGHLQTATLPPAQNTALDPNLLRLCWWVEILTACPAMTEMAAC